MRRLFAGFAMASAILVLSSCDIVLNGEYGGFNYSLQGTWETSPGDLANARLEITFDRIAITINGFLWPDQPLFGFTQNFPLAGYSEEINSSFSFKDGNIYIRNAGSWEGPIPYVYEAQGFQEVLILKGSSTINNLNFHRQ